MTKLVFHLGDMKTGSTAIQTALSLKAWTCHSVRLLYPHGNRLSHVSFAQSLQGQVDGHKIERLVLEILEHIAATPSDVAVISAEHFENVEPTILKDIILKYMPEMLEDARFIAYVRPHAERLPSSFAEKVKTGQYVGTLAELQAQMSRRKALLYMPRFQGWRDTFGAAFELRPMIRHMLYRQDVVADFLEFALQTQDFTLTGTPEANESVSLENLSILRQMHLKLNGGKHKGENYQSTVGRALARRMNDSNFRSGTKIRLHRALADQLCEEYAEDAAALDAAFFTGTPMTDALNAAPDKAVEFEQSLRIEDHYNEREQYLIDTLLDQTCILVKSDPDFLAEILRTEHRGNVVTTDGGEPKRRRAGKGHKAAGSQGGQGNVAGGGRVGPAKRARLAVAAGEAATLPSARKGGLRKAGPGRARAGLRLFAAQQAAPVEPDDQ